MDSKKYIVYFQFKGNEESQIIESIVCDDGDSLRYKLLIDMAIKFWGDSHKIRIIATEISDIKVFNEEQKLIVEQPIFFDSNTICECK